MLELTISSISTAIINLIVFSLVPVIWWFFRHRKETGFFKWIGFYRPQLKSKWWILLIFAVLYYFFYNFDFTQLVDPKTLEYIESSSAVSANVFAGIGFTAILPAFIENFVANGVAEEVLYRGFYREKIIGKCLPISVSDCATFGCNPVFMQWDGSSHTKESGTSAPDSRQNLPLSGC